MEICRREKSNINRIILSCILLLLTGTAAGQDRHPLIPDGIVLQHAGSIGFMSIGGTYEIFPNRRGNIDVLYGFVPGSKGGPLHIITGKFAYRPLVLKVGDLVTFYPLNPGVFLSYTPDKDLSVIFDPNQYGKGYYGWSEAVRFHLSFSQEAELNTRGLLRERSAPGVVLYSELSASDLYLISWVQNTGELALTDIFKVGIGLKVKF
jgi:hypothetical protein